MLPVLPGFAGQVPEGFAALHPGSKFARQIWQNFNYNYSGVYLLDPTDRLFVDIGKLFIQEQTKV
jgi:alpha-N-acetylglucosaminidase